MAVSPPLVRELPKELLWNLTLREVRGKYKRSTLGWLWSVVNPLANILVYTVVFATFLKIEPPVGDPSGLHFFVFYLVCALLPWTFLANGLNGAAGSITGNEGLIKKVYFPRAVLPTASVLSWLFSFGVEMAVLVVVLLFAGNMVLPWLPAVVVLMALQTGFVLGLAMLLAAANAYFRDVQHFLAIALNIWFYATPIIYPPNLPGIPSWAQTAFKFNPMYQFVEAYRDLLYDLRWPQLIDWAILLGISVGSLALGAAGFRRLEPRLAEEL